MQFDILTIFPDLLNSPLQEGIIRRAIQSGKITVNITNIRDFATDKHAMTDDRPFGGGEGMVMKPEPIAGALESVGTGSENPPKVILLSPQGRTFDQKMAGELSEEDHLVFLCGRYEGVDARVMELFVDDEVSIGDYILTGGELAAMVMVDTITRLLPGVLGCSDSASQDTFSNGMLKHPQYTRPRSFQGLDIPDVLLTGDHQAIQEWRFAESVKKTLQKRPEMLAGRLFSKAERKILARFGLLAEVDGAEGAEKKNR